VIRNYGLEGRIESAIEAYKGLQGEGTETDVCRVAFAATASKPFLPIPTSPSRDAPSASKPQKPTPVGRVVKSFDERGTRPT
jgi:hypothetical protein